MSSEYVFTMYGLSRVHPPDKEVLRDISLSFFPGAKIGVLGLNGSGKSTLLRIMAGIDTEFRGEARLAPGATVGPARAGAPTRSRQGRARQRRRGCRRDACLLDRFNELAANYSDENAAEFARVQEQIDAADAWSLDNKLDIAMDALRLPPGDADVTKLSGGERRRVALCRLLLAEPGPAAARRAHQPPRRGVGGLAREAPRGLPRHRRCGDPRPLLPRQRGRLDPGARPRPRDPVQGQLLELARAEASAAGDRGEARHRAQAHDRGRAGVGAPEPEGPAQAVQGAPEQLRAPARRGPQPQARPGPDPHSRRASAVWARR